MPVTQQLLDNLTLAASQASQLCQDLAAEQVITQQQIDRVRLINCQPCPDDSATESAINSALSTIVDLQNCLNQAIATEASQTAQLDQKADDCNIPA